MFNKSILANKNRDRQFQMIAIRSSFSCVMSGDNSFEKIFKSLEV